MDEPKVARRKGKDKAKDTFNKFGKNTQKHIRAVEKLNEIASSKNKGTKKKKDTPPT